MTSEFAHNKFQELCSIYQYSFVFTAKKTMEDYGIYLHLHLYNKTARENFLRKLIKRKKNNWKQNGIHRQCHQMNTT